MADLSIASAHIILLLFTVIPASLPTAHQEDDGNKLCYCHNDCKEQDHNNSLAFAVMSTFLERAVSKIDQLSTRQNQMMSELDEKIQTLYIHQKRSLNSTINDLKTELNISLVQVKDQAVAVEKRLATLYEQQKEVVKSSGDQLKSRCPLLFQYDSNSDICIKTSTEQVTWDEAKERCESIGAETRLAVLDTGDKRRFALCATGTSADWWVGARRESGQYKWSTSRDVEVGAWEAGQPDNRSDEKCVDFRRSGYLGDYGCHNGQGYRPICEFYMN